jgi:hypothetical protein
VGNDLSIRDDTTYSDRPPGTALIGAPFYWAGGFLPRPLHNLPTRHDEGNPRLAYLLMLPALAGAGAVVIVFRLLRGYDLSLFAALTASLAFAFGTTNWKYGGVLFSHSLSALLVMGAVALAIRASRTSELRRGTGLLLGLTLGLAVLVDYSSALFGLLVGVYLLVTLNWALFTGERWWFSALLLGAGALLPVGLLMGYNAANFGGPLTTSYRYAINYPWAASFTTTFDVPFRQGLPGMLWYGHDALGEENQGLFLLMPVALLGLAGVGRTVKRARQESILVLGLFAAALLLFARHHTFSGFTADGRYLMPFLGLWFVPVGFALASIEEIEAPAWKTAALFAAYGLLFLSVRNMLAHIAFSYNYHLDPGLVARRASTPANWAYMLGSVFVNWWNVPLLWLVEGVAIAAWLGARRISPFAEPSVRHLPHRDGGS